jgi:transcriptional regulator with XRE-family HTH domain
MPENARGGSERIDWRGWMRAFGRQQRRLREFLGFSQEQLAKLAGVSQGAVSRLETGRGLATPMLVILKINLAMRKALRAVDPSLLTEELRSVLEMVDKISPAIGDIGGVEAMPLTKDPEVEGLVRMYRGLPTRQRQAFVSVARATAAALAAGDREK